MAWTQADIDALKKSLSIRQVMEGGRMVTNEEFEKRLRLLALMEAEVHGKRRSLVEQPSFRRGDE